MIALERGSKLAKKLNGCSVGVKIPSDVRFPTQGFRRTFKLYRRRWDHDAYSPAGPRPRVD